MSGQSPDEAQPQHRYARWRERLRERRGLNILYRSLVTLVGTLVLVIGIIAIPYPGPGWLIVFAGLAILATEFERARQLLHWTRARYDSWTAWLRQQRPAVRLVVIVTTGLVVLATLWLLGTFGLIAGWFGMHGDWLRSPLS